jgi:rubrerythrin
MESDEAGETVFDEIMGGASEMLTDRRRFMSGAAKLGVGGALASFATGGAAAAEGDDVSDIDILNYALTLERLEANYYTEALEEFDELRDFERPGTPGGEAFRAPPLQYGTYGYLERIRDHERAHVDALVATIEDLGGDPVGKAEYEFPYETPEEFVAVGVALENTGVTAYAGAAPLIESAEVAKAALSIHSIEARHAAYLGVLDQRLPYPNGAFDPARSMEEVLAIASQFIAE